MISLNYDLNMFYCMDCTMDAHFQPMGIYKKSLTLTESVSASHLQF